MRRSILLACIAIVLLAASAVASPQTFRIDPGKTQSVVFTSKAPLETFEGKTDQVRGTIVADLANLADSVQVHVVVDLASMTTGIGMRDKHMREQHLETDKFPEAVFTGGTILSCEPPRLLPGTAAHAVVAGVFSLHGVSQTIEVPVDLTLGADGSLAVQAAFPVLLSDHDIARPRMLVLKLADEQQVNIALRAVPTAAAP